MMGQNVVVFGPDHVNTLGIIRSLGEAQIKPKVVVQSKREKSFVLKSKYIKKGVLTATNEDALKVLLDFGKASNDKSFLIPASDGQVKFIDNYRNLLAQYYEMPSVNEGFNKILNKARMAEVAENVGVNVPKTVNFDFENKSDEKIREIAQTFKDFYPLIIRFNGETKTNFDFLKINNEKELIETLDKTTTGEALIQEFIEMEEEIGIQGVSWGGAENQVVIPGVVHKIRKSLVALGSTTFAHLEEPKEFELLEGLKRFIAETKYNGIFDIEMMRKGDKYYFAECNFRNGAYGYAYTKYGYNLPLIWITQDQSVHKTKPVFLMNERSDFKYVKEKRVSFVKWISNYFKSVHLLTNIRDLRPTIANVLKR